MTRKIDGAVENRWAKALSHPLRCELLTLLNEGIASPSELADRLGEPLGNVSYHVRMLAEMGCVELVRTTPKRGAIEHHYRALARPFLGDTDWAALPPSARASLAGDRARRIWEDMVAAAEAGTLERGDAHISRTALRLDAEGLREVAKLVAATLERALEIQSESADRLDSAQPGEHESFSSRLMLLHLSADA